MAAKGPGPGEVQMYEEMGATTDVTSCDFCRARGLGETVVLLVHTVDGEVDGYMHACDECAAEAGRRSAQKPGGGRGPMNDPRLRRR